MAVLRRRGTFVSMPETEVFPLFPGSVYAHMEDTTMTGNIPLTWRSI